MSTGKWLMFLKVRATAGSVNPVFLVQAIRNTSSAIVPSVMREIEIWRVAVLMINRHADEAEANSFRRAVELARLRRFDPAFHNFRRASD
jgi:hypothetical protein